MRTVAHLIEDIAGHPIRFSSAALGSRTGGSGRHHGVEFDVMLAAAGMVYEGEVTNEALASRIRRIRREQSAKFSSSHS
jgi:hypothetical protein